MGADVKPGEGNKTPFFRAMDSIGNTATVEQLRAIEQQLVRGDSLLSIYMNFEHAANAGTVAAAAKDKEHVGEHWFRAWWPEHKPEDKMRAGIIQVVRLQLEKTPPRKVDYWWVPAGEGFRVVPCVSDESVTVIVLTPTPPKPSGR
jgi:hypothetical protein